MFENGITEDITEVPMLDPYFWVDEDMKKILDVAIDQTEHENIMILGPTGCGKTSLAMYIAASKNRPFFRMDVANIEDPTAWWGLIMLKKDKTEFVPGAFLKAISVPNTIILLDEVTRVPPEMHNVLFPLLDGWGKTYIDYAEREVKVAKGVRFIGSANIGVEYTGTYTMDRAWRNRWGIQVEVHWLPKEAEINVVEKKTGLDNDMAQQLVQFANAVRQDAEENNRLREGISTRQILTVGNLIANGLSPNEAISVLLPNWSKAKGVGGSAGDSERMRVMHHSASTFTIT